MAKHKKTKQQKIITDLRRKLYPKVENSYASEKSKDMPSVQEDQFKEQPNTYLSKTINYIAPSYSLKKADKSSNVINYNYITDDLKKTGILTGSVIVAQLILFYLLKTHTIVLPMIKY